MKAVLCLAVLAAAAVAAGSAGAATRNCGTLSLGPGALERGNAAGPTCLLRAYRACAAATFTVSRHGVDTVETDTFAVARTSAGCRVPATVSFRVVPQQPRVSHTRCNAVKRRGTDVVAVGCGAPLASTVTLNR